MPTYRKQTLGNGGSPPTPAIVPLTGLQPMRRAPATEVPVAQDKVAPMGRRILLSHGLSGSFAWRIASLDPTSTLSRIYPDRTTWYEIGRARVEVTPGCRLETGGWCLASGSTQYPFGGEFRFDGIHGRIRVTIVWRDRAGGTETTTNELSLPGSTLTWGAESSDAGALFRDAEDIPVVKLRPPGVLADASELRRFSQHITADILIEHQGSPRVGDFWIAEMPDLYALEDADAQYRTQHVAPGGAPPAFPREVLTATDPRSGTLGILGTADAQANHLGPMLFQAHCYSEVGATSTATIVPLTTANDGTVFESILDSSVHAYAASEPGWSVSTGGYARSWRDASPLVLYDRTCVVPVVVRVYGRVITAGVGTVRVMTNTDSYVDVPIAISGSNGWTTAYGWLEVGISPEQPRVAQVFFRHTGASGSLSIEAVECYFSATAAVI